MKTSLRSRIVTRLKEIGGWVHKGQIESRAKEWGYLGETAGRRCRELVEEDILEVKQENGSDLYRYKPQSVIKSSYTVVDGRVIESKQAVLI